MTPQFVNLFFHNMVALYQELNFKLYEKFEPITLRNFKHVVTICKNSTLIGLKNLMCETGLLEQS